MSRRVSRKVSRRLSRKVKWTGGADRVSSRWAERREGTTRGNTERDPAAAAAGGLLTSLVAAESNAVAVVAVAAVVVGRCGWLQLLALPAVS